MIRPFIALALAVPLYITIGFGWEFFLIFGLQSLAGLEVNLFNNK